MTFWTMPNEKKCYILTICSLLIVRILFLIVYCVILFLGQLMKWICLCIKYQGSDPHRGGGGLAKVSADILKKVNAKRKSMNYTKKGKYKRKKPF